MTRLRLEASPGGRYKDRKKRWEVLRPGYLSTSFTMLSFSKLAAFAVLASAATVKAQAGTCIRTYEVMPGDFCDKIAAAQGVSRLVEWIYLP